MDLLPGDSYRAAGVEAAHIRPNHAVFATHLATSCRDLATFAAHNTKRQVVRSREVA